mgnify:CR=1 FL=1
MSRKDAINSLFLGKRDMAAPAPTRPAERPRSGAIAAMGASLQEAADAAQAAGQLQERLAQGQIVVGLPPDLIEASTIADRIPVDDDPHFTQLVESIRASGQHAPILVRPHAHKAGRYEIAYGRRRWRAAAALGIDVKAIVRQLSDAELIVAQGRENLDRQDLSFIEKARFALRLDEAGFDRAVIMEALATDKADLSRYLSIVKATPEVLIGVIGPAPSIGRARWQSFAERLQAGGAEAIAAAQSAAAAAKAHGVDSDGRFQQALAALDIRPSPRARDVWSTPEGKPAAVIEHRRGKTTITLDDKAAPDFARYLTSRLSALFDEFAASRPPGSGPSQRSRS